MMFGVELKRGNAVRDGGLHEFGDPAVVNSVPRSLTPMLNQPEISIQQGPSC
jgi:hypothetical protein